MAKGVQELLQDELSGNGIEFFFARPPVSHACAAQTRVGFGRTEPLVGQVHGETETFVQLIGKTSAMRFERVLALAIERARQADDEGDRLPFFDQAGNGVEPRVNGFKGEGGKRAGKTGFDFAGGDADADEAEIEAKEAAARG
jgi:hypothetical protein